MALVAADGTFVTNGDLPGPYFVYAYAPAGWHLRAVTQGGRNVTDDPIDLSSDASGLIATFVDVVSKLVGTVVDASGAPDPHAVVMAFPADSDGWRRGEGSPRRLLRTPSTSSGAYALDSLPAGQYYVVAVADGAAGEWPAPGFVAALVAGATRVTIAEGEAKTVSLKTFAIR